MDSVDARAEQLAASDWPEVGRDAMEFVDSTAASEFGGVRRNGHAAEFQQPDGDVVVDHEIQRRLVGILRSCGLERLDEVRVVVGQGCIALAGRLHSEPLRKWCLDVTRRLSRGHRIVDRLEVGAPRPLR